MTPAKLKAALEAQGSLFFSRNNMRFSGDTMANYGVRAAIIDTYTESAVKCWEVYRRKPVKHGVASSAYFDVKTLKQRWPKI